MHFWRMILWRTKSTIISWHGSNVKVVKSDRSLHGNTFTSVAEVKFLIVGNPTPAGIVMKYKDSCGEMQLLKMAVSSQNKKDAQIWITSMLKVNIILPPPSGKLCLWGVYCFHVRPSSVYLSVTILFFNNLKRQWHDFIKFGKLIGYPQDEHL